MKKITGWGCALILAVLLVVGIFFPTLGAEAGFWVDLSVLSFYVLLFMGACWGLIL